MNGMRSIRPYNRLKKALENAEKLTSIPIEVLILSNTSHKRLTDRIRFLFRERLLAPKHAVIGVDPVNRHVAVALCAERPIGLDSGELRTWLKGFQEDLHMTAPENALAVAVISLALALAERLPANGECE